MTYPYALQMLVETPDFQGFLLLPSFDNVLLFEWLSRISGGISGGTFFGFDRNGDSQQARD